MTYGRPYATATLVGAKQRSKARKKPMKLTLKQRIRNWLNSDDDHMNEAISIDRSEVSISRETTLRFEVHQAAGGRVVQTRRYDERKDRNIENLYVITPDQDFGREIDKIITMEALR
jgi:hypothetical protein